jgi:uncharacterized protein YbjT (DUF2867 family)
MNRRIFSALSVVLTTAWVAGAVPSAFAAAAAKSAPSILVVGATGGTGKEVVRQAREAGYRVRALVRDADKARGQLGSDVELVVGDVRTGAGVDAAVRGVDYVVSALGSNVRNDPTNTPERVDYGGVRDLVNAAASAKVKHFVLVSSMGVTHDDHPLNKMFGNILVWKRKGEEAVRASGVPYTIVRPGGLLDTPGGKAGIRTFQGDDLKNNGRIPRADVAAVCLKSLGNRSAAGKTFEIISGAEGGSVDWNGLFAALKADAR